MQVRQFYAVSSYSDTVDKTSAVGTIGGIKKIEDCLGDQVMFFFKGADTVLRSDFIQIKNIGYAKAIKASDMVIPMKKVRVVLDPTSRTSSQAVMPPSITRMPLYMLLLV